MHNGASPPTKFNLHSIGICYEGGLNAKGQFDDTRTEAQKRSMAKLIWELSARFPKARILGYCDLPGVHKVCPCYDVAENLNGEKPYQSLKTLPQIRGRPSLGRNIMPQIQGMISQGRNNFTPIRVTFPRVRDFFPQNWGIFLRHQDFFSQNEVIFHRGLTISPLIQGTFLRGRNIFPPNRVTFLLGQNVFPKI